MKHKPIKLNFGFLVRKGEKPYGLPNAINDYLAIKNPTNLWRFYESTIEAMPQGKVLEKYGGFASTKDFFMTQTLFNSMARHELDEDELLRCYMHKHSAFAKIFLCYFVKQELIKRMRKK